MPAQRRGIERWKNTIKMTKEKDIQLDTQDDLVMQNGDFAAGESLLQEVGILLRLNQGELKSDPLLGPNLIELEKGTASAKAFKTRVRLHLQRDGKDYQQIKEKMKFTFKNA